MKKVETTPIEYKIGYRNNDLIKEYKEKYGKVIYGSYTDEELTNIIAFYLTSLEHSDIVYPTICWTFYPAGAPNIISLFKNPEGIWESYYCNERSTELDGRVLYKNSYDCFIDIFDINTGTDEDYQKVIKTFDNYIKEGFSQEFMEDIKNNFLIVTDEDDTNRSIDELMKYTKNVLKPLTKKRTLQYID